MEIKTVKTKEELRSVLELCYRILGEDRSDLYGYEAWEKRLEDGLSPLVYAAEEDRIVAAVLGRAENEKSMVIGFTACDEAYRRRGITRRLMTYFEERAREMGYEYITLGSKADAFYVSCGYQVIFRIHGQNIYQKKL